MNNGEWITWMRLSRLSTKETVGSQKEVFELIQVVSTEYGFMSIPLVLQELVLAIWLITKGFNLKTTNILS